MKGREYGVPETEHGRGAVLTEQDERLTAAMYQITRIPMVLVLEDGSRVEAAPEFLDGYVVPDDPKSLETRTAERLVLLDKQNSKLFFRIVRREGARIRINLMRAGD
jgi:hypothetical protein